MRGESGHYEISNSDWIRLHASIPWETKTIHKISSRNITWSLPIKVYLWSSLPSLSSKGFFTAWVSHWTAGLSVKSITLSQSAPDIFEMPDLLCLV